MKRRVFSIAMFKKILLSINTYPFSNLLPSKSVRQLVRFEESSDVIACSLRANVLKAKREEGLQGKIRTSGDRESGIKFLCGGIPQNKTYQNKTK